MRDFQEMGVQLDARYIRLSSGDPSDIQARALEEGAPYQTLIASVLHKYVTGCLEECPAASARGRR